MEFPKEADVLVVGGGPGGIMAAIVCAKNGLDVVVVDRKSKDLIGNKTCGEALDKPAPLLFEKELGINLPDETVSPSKIRFLSFAAGSINNKLKAETPAWIVDRLKYGQYLLKKAEDFGVKVFGNSVAREILLKGDMIEGMRIAHNGKMHELRAKVTVDASGFPAVVRRQIPSEVKKFVSYEITPHNIVATYREIVELNVEHDYQDEIVLLYDKRIPLPGYAWVFTSGDKKLNLGITWPKDIPYPRNKSLKDIYHEVLDEIVSPKSYKVVHTGGGQIPVRPPFDSVVFNGGVLVGDAGCMVDPTTAEGHGPALLSGYAAGKTITKAIKSGKWRKEDLWYYNKEVMRLVGKVSGMSMVAREFIEDVGTRKLAFLIKRKFVSQRDLEQIFQEDNFNLSKLSIASRFARITPYNYLGIKVNNALKKIEKVSDLYQEYPESPEKLKEWIERRRGLLSFR